MPAPSSTLHPPVGSKDISCVCIGSSVPQDRHDVRLTVFGNPVGTGPHGMFDKRSTEPGYAHLNAVVHFPVGFEPVARDPKAVVVQRSAVFFPGPNAMNAGQEGFLKAVLAIYEQPSTVTIPRVPGISSRDNLRRRQDLPSSWGMPMHIFSGPRQDCSAHRPLRDITVVCGGTAARRLMDVDQAVTVGVEPDERLVRTQEFAEGDVAVVVAVHLLKPVRTGGGDRPWRVGRRVIEVATDDERQR